MQLDVTPAHVQNCETEMLAPAGWFGQAPSATSLNCRRVGSPAHHVDGAAGDAVMHLLIGDDHPAVLHDARDDDRQHRDDERELDRGRPSPGARKSPRSAGEAGDHAVSLTTLPTWIWPNPAPVQLALKVVSPDHWTVWATICVQPFVPAKLPR